MLKKCDMFLTTRPPGEGAVCPGVRRMAPAPGAPPHVPLEILVHLELLPLEEV